VGFQEVGGFGAKTGTLINQFCSLIPENGLSWMTTKGATPGLVQSSSIELKLYGSICKIEPAHLIIDK
jgi:hypothetical protein